MAFTLSLRTVGDYGILEANVVPIVPKSGWEPAIGQLAVFDSSANVWDLAAADEPPGGLVQTINGTTGTAGMILLVPGTQLVLPFDTAPTAGQQIQATAAGLKVVGTANFSRSQVKGVASGGVGTIIDLATFGVSGSGTETTATVLF